MKFTFLCTIAVLSLACCPVYGQESKVLIPEKVRLPRDTVLRRALLQSLDAFLLQVPNENKTNTYVLPENLPETSALLDEMKDIESDETRKEEHFYKVYLQNATVLSDTDFLIQLAYIGVQDGLADLRACFTLMAKKRAGHFYFSSPLKENTKAWKHVAINNNMVYYKTAVDMAHAKNYFNTIAAYDKQLGAAAKPADFYCAENFHEVLQLTGVDYKADYNGFARNTLSSLENGRSLSVNGFLTPAFSKFDTHDLWHDRLHRMVPVNTINRPVDEGTAYLYGNGSWGITWPEVCKQFKAYAAAHPDADWLQLYNESVMFNGDRNAPLNVDFMINALIVQQTEKEHGFPAVIALLTCGRKEKDNANYFEALQRITGIDKAHFNEKVWELVRAD